MSERPLTGQARFRIERELADTLQGRIYSGTDLVTNKRVVVKEAWRQLVKSGRTRKGHVVPENFLAEREMIMKLTTLPDCSDGLVKGIAEWDDEHCHYYAMEFCEGELFQFISDTHTTKYKKFVAQQANLMQVPMAKPNQMVRDITRMFYDICCAVHWMHNKDYCHLDLSLENTMIATIDQLIVKIIDFGLTKHFPDRNFMSKGKIGKLQYMSPEVYARKEYDARAADTWCLGVMLFMMLIGAPPYPAPSPQYPAFKFIVRGRMNDVLKHWKRLRLVTDEALDLMQKMFQYESKRISLDEVLQHAFFEDVRREKEERLVQKQAQQTQEAKEVSESSKSSQNEKMTLLNAEHKAQSIEMSDDDDNNNNNDSNNNNNNNEQQPTTTTSTTTTTQVDTEMKESNPSNKQLQQQHEQYTSNSSSINTNGSNQSKNSNYSKGDQELSNSKSKSSIESDQETQALASQQTSDADVKHNKKRGPKKFLCGVNGRCTIA